MSIEYALILAAGKGTRMGEIGKVLPKVLWPVYEKSLLALEVQYAKSLGAKKIFINVFNYKEIILKHIKNDPVFSDVTILVEEERLDVGGAVHNLAKEVGYDGRVLILNADQFIILKDKIREDFFAVSEDYDDTLVTFKVNSSDGYNALISSSGKLSSIENNKNIPRNKLIDTYTGLSIIDLSSLEKISGESKFFESVANPKKRKVRLLSMKDSSYWDFGTIDRYAKSSFKVLSLKEGSPFFDFLVSSNALNKEKISYQKNSYGTDTKKNCINLSGEDIVADDSIILRNLTKSKVMPGKIIYEEVSVDF